MVDLFLNSAFGSRKLFRGEMNRELQSPSQAHDTAGEAVFPGKEAWKNEPGNRYTPQELREMERNWKIRITDPNVLANSFPG